MNERITEDFVRVRLKNHGHTYTEQQTEIVNARELLRNASKQGSGWGFPEFIVFDREDCDWLIVIECKADVKFHQDKNDKTDLLSEFIVFYQTTDSKKNTARYGVEGVQHYMKALAKSFNVIGVAVSGNEKCHLIDTFVQRKGEAGCVILLTPSGDKITTILSWLNYKRCVDHDPDFYAVSQQELADFTKQSHEFMWRYLGLANNEKPLMVAGTLMALKRKVFREGYSSCPSNELAAEWENAIKSEINSYGLPEKTRNKMLDIYHSIAIHPELNKGGSSEYPRSVLHEMIKRLHDKVFPLANADERTDSLGKFYGEFLSFTGGDKQDLGIVLTPKHITEMSASLMNLRPDSKILDICAGTCGFVISAYSIMSRFGKVDPSKITGVEQQPHMHALAAANLSLRDGQLVAGILQGDCFDKDISDKVRKRECNVSFINPPYSQDGDRSELAFVKHSLDLLQPRGRGLALVPVGCAHKPIDKTYREELLKHHTLEAVMTLPDQLFHGVGTNPCLMIFTAHVPHVEAGVKTWFASWKDDGFVKKRQFGRVETDRWAIIREHWITSFRNKEIKAGFSITRTVTADDIWLAEAYIEPDYASVLTPDLFNTRLKRLLSHLIMQSSDDLLIDEGKLDE